MILKRAIAVSAILLASQMASAAEYAKVVSYDFGSIDTLHALGLSDVVAGVPKQGLPNYLSEFSGDQYADIGGLKNPDVEALKSIQPDLVLVTGRQGSKIPELEALFNVQNVGAQGEDYWTGFSQKVNDLAASFDKESEAATALQALKKQIDQVKGSNKSVVVLTHNGGNVSLRNDGVVNDLLGLKTPTLPEGVETIKRGARSFTPLTAANVAAMKPAVVMIVDRSAAIGAESGAMDMESFKAELAANGGSDIQVAYLEPELWYLSGGGLESLKLQVAEVAKALN
ncbi:ABC transporter substrate-binding protein [Rhodanobacter aciditrophus]|uniref:ABC transporter substrate-binding protein n=1 Tax=Rhodanobacter aciditrophus TaxID=1623218 RepID=A0ABW4B183_9GAMM